jgi:hypothetical protein
MAEKLVMSAMLRESEAAAEMLLKPATLEQWRMRKKHLKLLPYYKVGGRVLYRREDVENFLANSRVDDEHPASRLRSTGRRNGAKPRRRLRSS